MADINITKLSSLAENVQSEPQFLLCFAEYIQSVEIQSCCISLSYLLQVVLMSNNGTLYANILGRPMIAMTMTGHNLKQKTHYTSLHCVSGKSHFLISSLLYLRQIRLTGNRRSGHTELKTSPQINMCVLTRL